MLALNKATCTTAVSADAYPLFSIFIYVVTVIREGVHYTN